MRCREAAQSCVAMLSAPGGLFLDVKSAYSSAADLKLFVAALAGIGVHVKVRNLRQASVIARSARPCAGHTTANHRAFP